MKKSHFYHRTPYHKGPFGQLKSLKDTLLCYVFELHEQGATINTFTVVLRASFLSPKSRTKTFTAHCSAMKCFFVSHSFAY